MNDKEKEALIQEKIRAGLTRQQAIEVIGYQAAHDEALKKAEAKKDAKEDKPAKEEKPAKAGGGK